MTISKTITNIENGEIETQTYTLDATQFSSPYLRIGNNNPFIDTKNYTSEIGGQLNVASYNGDIYSFIVKKQDIDDNLITLPNSKELSTVYYQKDPTPNSTARKIQYDIFKNNALEFAVDIDFIVIMEEVSSVYIINIIIT